MRSRTKWLVVVLVLAVVCLGGWAGYAQNETRTAKRTVWEYKIETSLTEEQLNQLSLQGWELVAVVNNSGGGGYFQYFKRAK